MKNLRERKLTKNEQFDAGGLKNFFIIALIFTCVCIGIGFFYIQRSSKIELADSLVESSREQLLVGDSRAAMVIFGKSIPRWFQSAILYKTNGEIVFSLEEGPCFLCLNVSQPIWFVRNEKSFGFVKLSYSIAGLIEKLLIFFSLAIITFSFVFRREKKKLFEAVVAAKRISSLEVENRFARQVSHDIRSPLSAIKMLVSLPTLDRPEVKEILIRSADKINLIAQDLLDKSKRADYAAEDLKITKIDINKFLNTLIKEKQVEYQKLEEVEISYQGTNEETILEIDILSFDRAISNLINNAIEAKIKEEIQVKIIATLGDGFLKILIADNGAGMSVELLEKLGKRQISFGKELTNSGSGIGVWQAFQLIEKMRGKISYMSKPNFGTTVTIILPLC